MAAENNDYRAVPDAEVRPVDEQPKSTKQNTTKRADVEAALPTYDEVKESDAGPPPYKSLFCQLSDAHKQSTSCIDMNVRVFSVLSKKYAIKAGFMLIGFALLSTIITMGTIFYGQCPASRFLEFFCVVGGSVGLVSLVMVCFTPYVKSKTSKVFLIVFVTIESTLTFFLGTIYTLTAVITLGVQRESNLDSDSDKYCNPTFLSFVMAVTVGPLGFLVAWSLLLTVILVIAGCVSSKVE